jgi:hypothetical protein
MADIGALPMAPTLQNRHDTENFGLVSDVDDQLFKMHTFDGKTQSTWPRHLHVNGRSGLQHRDRGTHSRRWSANAGLFAKTREISVRHGLRGGAGRTRTSNQAIMSALPLTGTIRCR